MNHSHRSGSPYGHFAGLDDSDAAHHAEITRRIAIAERKRELRRRLRKDAMIYLVVAGIVFWWMLALAGLLDSPSDHAGPSGRPHGLTRHQIAEVR